jgi:hypothetical protein
LATRSMVSGSTVSWRASHLTTLVPYEWDRAHPGNDYAGTATAGALSAGMTTSSRSFKAVASTVRPAVVR